MIQSLTLREAAIELVFVTDAQFDQIVDPERW
jgi:fumarate hydratase class II